MLNDKLIEFYVEQNPRTLGEYLEMGGHINPELRAQIAYILKYQTTATRLRGKNKWRDYCIFQEATLRLKVSFLGVKLYKATEGVETGKALTEFKVLSQMAAERGISYQTVREQYKRGAQIKDILVEGGFAKV